MFSDITLTGRFQFEIEFTVLYTTLVNDGGTILLMLFTLPYHEVSITDGPLLLIMLLPVTHEIVVTGFVVTQLIIGTDEEIDDWKLLFDILFAGIRKSFLNMLLITLGVNSPLFLFVIADISLILLLV